MSIPTDRDLLVKAAGNLLNAANGFEDLNPTLARRLAAAVINDQSFGVDYLSRTQMKVESLAGAQQVAVPHGPASYVPLSADVLNDLWRQVVNLNPTVGNAHLRFARAIEQAARGKT